ncbi:MAG: M48 family metalloprotease [Comamonadaceae bacterium]|nr:M48 family metalloprotease [Comamonadaceae bacterium]
MAEAMKALRPHLGDYPSLRDKSDLVLVVPAANFNAFADHTEQRILIPLMMCVETWYLIEGMMHAHLDPRLREKLQQYVAYLSKRQRDSLARATGFDNIVLQPFHEFSGAAFPTLSAADLQKNHSDRVRIMVDSMAFIIGHEFGHLALRHKPYNAISPEVARNQEAEADEFSARLLMKAGISVIAAATVIPRFLANEQIYKRASSGSMTHPRPECRFERILSTTGEVQELQRNPDRRRLFEAASGFSANDFARTMADLREDCQRSPLGGTPLARIIEARKADFEPLRTGRSELIDGERSWDAVVSLDGNRGCTVWAGTRDFEPRVNCSMGRRIRDDGQAHRIFSETLEMVRATIPGDWVRKESESGNRVRTRTIEYTGPGLRVRVALTKFEGIGSSDVNVTVYAVN